MKDDSLDFGIKDIQNKLFFILLTSVYKITSPKKVIPITIREISKTIADKFRFNVETFYGISQRYYNKFFSDIHLEVNKPKKKKICKIKKERKVINSQTTSILNTLFSFDRENYDCKDMVDIFIENYIISNYSRDEKKEKFISIEDICKEFTENFDLDFNKKIKKFFCALFETKYRDYLYQQNSIYLTKIPQQKNFEHAMNSLKSNLGRYF
jgi:hypothetical protein